MNALATRLDMSHYALNMDDQCRETVFELLMQISENPFRSAYHKQKDAFAHAKKVSNIVYLIAYRVRRNHHGVGQVIFTRPDIQYDVYNVEPFRIEKLPAGEL